MVVELIRVQPFRQSHYLGSGTADIHPGNDFHDTNPTVGLHTGSLLTGVAHVEKLTRDSGRSVHAVTAVVKCFIAPYLRVIEPRCSV
ncbi:hypothetical protein GCM10009525_86390 [Streptosporangium amethystogenes subsp. fukuiense]